MSDEIVILEQENKVIIVDSEELDPNGEPVMYEFTLEQWNQINDSDNL